MPWASNSDLPEGVRSALPADAQTRWRQVGNERLAAGASEQSAIRQAWHVVGLGWKKPKDGDKWVRKGVGEMPPELIVPLKRWRSAVTEQEFNKAEVFKVDEELGLVFGWGLVSKVEGEEFFDSQGDHIPEESMLKAAVDFMQDSRAAKEMHDGDQVGTIVFAFPLTADIAKSMDITTKYTGLMIAMRPTDPEVLAKFKSGEYSGFSIGGRRIEDEVVE